MKAGAQAPQPRSDDQRQRGRACILRALLLATRSPAPGHLTLKARRIQERIETGRPPGSDFTDGTRVLNMGSNTAGGVRRAPLLQDDQGKEEVP